MKPEPVPTPALEPLAALQQQLEMRVAATRNLHAASSASSNLADSAPNMATQQREVPSTAAATAPARAEPPLSSRKPGYLRQCGGGRAGVRGAGVESGMDDFSSRARAPHDMPSQDTLGRHLQTAEERVTTTF